MNAPSIEFGHSQQTKRVWLTAVILAVFVVGTIFLDLIEANFHDTSFYLSESFLFSSFWLIFLPLLAAQFTFFSKLRPASMRIMGLLLPPVIHLVSYPALVWTISNLFFEHTFACWQTLQYEVTTYSFVVLVIYAIPFLLYPYIQKKQEDKSNKDEVALPTTSVEFVTSFLVTEGTKRKVIPVNEIWYFSADSPYITIHQQEKNYLFNETLRSVSTKLNPDQFVRIHKSTIVNLTKVNFYQSRLNGDYDITLMDKTVLRLSRNYAANFKEKFRNTHPDTAE
jgi:hypothetical protein